MKTETNQSPEALAVIENQQAIAQASAAIQTMAEAVRKCAGQVTEMQAAMPDLATALDKRADLLAAIAVGEDKAAELAAISVQITQLEEKCATTGDAIDDVLQTIEGLNTRLAAARAALAALQDKRSKLLGVFIRSRANALGAAYVETAEKMIAQYKQLKALNDILELEDIRPQFAKFVGCLYIPRFRLESMPTAGVPALFANDIFSEVHQSGARRQWVEEEIANIRKLGIEVS